MLEDKGVDLDSRPLKIKINIKNKNNRKWTTNPKELRLRYLISENSSI